MYVVRIESLINKTTLYYFIKVIIVVPFLVYRSRKEDPVFDRNYAGRTKLTYVNIWVCFEWLIPEKVTEHRSWKDWPVLKEQIQSLKFKKS